LKGARGEQQGFVRNVEKKTRIGKKKKGKRFPSSSRPTRDAPPKKPMGQKKNPRNERLPEKKRPWLGQGEALPPTKRKGGVFQCVRKKSQRNHVSKTAQLSLECVFLHERAPPTKRKVQVPAL